MPHRTMDLSYGALEMDRRRCTEWRPGTHPVLLHLILLTTTTWLLATMAQMQISSLMEFVSPVPPPDLCYFKQVYLLT